MTEDRIPIAAPVASTAGRNMAPPPWMTAGGVTRMAETTMAMASPVEPAKRRPVAELSPGEVEDVMAVNFFAMLYALSIAELSLAAPAIASLTYIGNAVAEGRLNMLAEHALHLPTGYYFVHLPDVRNLHLLTLVRDWAVEAARPFREV